ncbi:electron transfer flavoprotein subunit alpha/FixB family protein [Cellulomonas sp.]|uniref:electron transfer flavoprotein subunit alpha/FixB family protein n=1 Tax=Cellulomonas sp. TaxID=40001 RepID=UPI002D350358|nr:electron transfer flavoprotein subunit alpha/FixB family protein [Cellulomonas sp.]HYQ74756.1 electron transfer flavoprotein subunit alpha/FixB family protein [Cellulomonas sp.]
MATVLVLLDHAETGALRGSVLELATAARDLADGGEVHGLWVGDEPVDPALPVLGRHGVAVVHQVSTGAVDARLTPVLAEVLADAVRETGATVLLALSTFENKEAAARLAVATGAGVVTDAAAVERDAEGRVVASKTVLAGTWTTRCAVRTDLAVVLLKAGAVVSRHVEEPAPLAPELRTRALAVSERATRAALVRRTPAAPSDRPDLSSADVVVVGGRGTEGDFAPIEALADAVGGAVGSTRVATDEGWIGHETQIGQTGVTVSPRLYIGAGVSGAVHHRGGMQASGTIVAVNPDPEAPIFEIADYGVVGDLFTVLPQLTEELRRLRQG